MDSEVKSCRWCCGEIPIAARRCPHCTTMQGFWWHGILALIPALVVGLLFILFFSHVFSRSPNYADQVEIADSKMVFGKYDGHVT
ncbi:MAG: hypothetical protein IH898_08760, partial [Planctomycetes bacterium]|nr:hypothetical protein [Planctomycetota bacterium]